MALYYTLQYPLICTTAVHHDPVVNYRLIGTGNNGMIIIRIPPSPNRKEEKRKRRG
jgi:hypothetical protein